MTASPSQLPLQPRFGLDVATVFAGIVLPAVLLVADFALGQAVLGLAPAALLAFYCLGVAALVLSAFVRQDTPMVSVLSGVLAASSILLWALALPLALLSAVGLVLGVVGTAHGDLTALAFVAISVLSLTPIWTAIIYTKCARVMIGAGSRSLGPSRALALGISGASVLGVAMLLSHSADRAWVRARVEQITKAAPERWAAALAELSAYPLCGDWRCRQFVCDQLFREFGAIHDRTLYPAPNVPPHLAPGLVSYLGAPLSMRCALGD
jgi:hypothetical protein